jgi:hypothetical protein
VEELTEAQKALLKQGSGNGDLDTWVKEFAAACDKKDVAQGVQKPKKD